MPNPLDALLASYNVNTLYALAVEAGIFSRKGPKAPKAELVSVMKKYFFTEARVQASLAKLDPHERGVLNRLQLRGGAALTRSLQREVVRVGLASTPPEVKGSAYNTTYVAYAQPGEYTGSLNNPKSTIFQDIVARLTFHGLVFSRAEAGSYASTYKFQYHPAAEVFIPAEVLRYLPAPTPDASRTEDWQPPRVVAGDIGSFLRDLYLYWDLVRRAPIALLNNGMVGKRQLKTINEALLTPDPSVERAGNETDARRLYLLRQLLEALKLVEARDGRLTAVAPDSTSLPQFFTLDTPTQIARCVAVWLSLDERALAFSGELSRAYPQVTNARQTLLKTLRGMGADLWFDMEEIMERLQDADPNFLFSKRRGMEHNYSSGYYYYGGSQRSSLAELRRKFDRAEMEFARTALTGFLFEMGIVELGYADAKAKTASFLRIGANGAQILAGLTVGGQGGVSATLPPLAAEDAHEGRVVLQPNFQILALGPVKLDILARLDLFADRRKADPNAFEYHLSRESVYRAQQAGFGVPDIAAFLRQVSGADIPQNVQRTMDEWAAHHERIVFRAPVALLQAADEADLPALLAHTELAPLLRAVSPTVAVAATDGADVLKPLLGIGQFPAVAEVDPTSADHSVSVDDDGVLSAAHAVPSLFLERRLERVAERVEGAWRVTADVVRREGTGRDAVNRYTMELERLARGPLPAPVVERIRRWGGYYGAAAIETLTLVEMRDLQALAELRQDAVLRDLLTPFPAGDRALAVVPTERIAALEARLAELGVVVRRGLAGQ
ncbi:MAG: helicase-associated domain-containing protein [Anaerolineae bacterium]